MLLRASIRLLFTLLLLQLGCDGPNAVVTDGEVDITPIAGLVLPQWSPDGSQIVAVAASAQRDRAYIFNTDGTGLHTVGESKAGIIFSATWLGHNRNLLIAGQRLEQDSLINGIWALNIDSGAERLVTSDPYLIGDFPWPNISGDSIAIIWGKEIRLFGSAGGPSRTVAQFATDYLVSAELSWAGDGSHIFVSWGDIFSVSVATSHVEVCVDREDLNRSNSLATWAYGKITNVAKRPVGPHIAFNFFSNIGPIERGLFIYNPEDSTVTRPAYGFWPGWSRDGVWIAYSREDRLYKKRLF